MNKILFSLLLISSSLIICDESQKTDDPTEQYRTAKAREAIIHDAYYEAKPWNAELPNSFKIALEKFGFKKDDIQFYTAVRTNRFVERVDNNLVILYPNFFLYLTEAEQSAYIGLQLASLRAGEETDVGGSHETFIPKKSSFKSIKSMSLGATALGLAALYHRSLWKQSQALWPTIKDILTSKGAGLVATCAAVNGIKQLLEKRGDIKKLSAAQYMVIDTLGSEGLLSIREKQVQWGYRNNWWLTCKLHAILGKLSLVYSPEADLERIKEYCKEKGKKI